MRRAVAALAARASAAFTTGAPRSSSFAAARAVATTPTPPDAPPSSSGRAGDAPPSSSGRGDDATPSPSSPRHPQFTVVGRLTGATPPRPAPVFAVVQLGGTQVKLSPDDLVYTDALPGVSVQDVLRLDRVLVVGSRTATRVGRPLLPDAAVTVAVEEVTRDARVTHFHKRRRKASRRTTGHRQPVTALRVLAVEGVEP